MEMTKMKDTEFEAQIAADIAEWAKDKHLDDISYKDIVKMYWEEKLGG